MSSLRAIVAVLLITAACAPAAHAQAVNNCLASDYGDRRGQSRFTISAVMQPGVFRYTPRCVIADAGTIIDFTLDFGAHPTIGGRVVAGTGMADPASPIGAITFGKTAAITFPDAGIFPFYCDFHVAQAMMGAIEIPFVAGFE